MSPGVAAPPWRGATWSARARPGSGGIAAALRATLNPVRDKWNLTGPWLAEKVASPEEWSIRDRDDIVFFIEKKRSELNKTPEHHQPLRRGREEFLAELEAAMERYVRSK